VPGAFLFLGIGNASKHTDVALHNSRFQMDEDQMPLGAAMLVETALAALQELKDGKDTARCGDESGDGAAATCAMGTNIEGDD